MRILHVWDMAGVAAIISRQQRSMGHSSTVVKRAGHDPYSIDCYYGTVLLNLSPARFYTYTLKASKHADIVHVHGIPKLFLLLLATGRNVFLHLHGSETRRMPAWMITMLRRFQRRILVATPDLLSVFQDATLIPTPVDTSLFNPNVKPERCSLQPVPYTRMPGHLASLPYYKETKPWYLSKTALEALAVGTPVIWNGLRISPPLPRQHHPEHAAETCLKTYEKI